MTGQKADLRNVSLVCVETRYPALAQYAIERCLAQATFKECLLLSPVRHALPEHIRQVTIAPIDSVEAYSVFMLRELGQYFSGDHVLVIQWDSFILNGASWRPEFLDYDYIGAPWPHRPVAVAVGNGGFSLRSKRLCEALLKLEIGQTHPEDFVICEAHREELIEKHGIVFAPREVADHFAFEETRPAAPTFGFHGFFNFSRVLGDTEMTDYIALCDDKTMRAGTTRRLIRTLYHDGRYAMARRILKRRMGGSFGMAADAFWLSLRSRWHGLTRGRAKRA
jgi:hypothetical protein